MSSGPEAKERVVLDSSAYSRFRSGHPDVYEILSSAAVVLIPVIVLGELEAGFELGRRARANRVALAEFLAEPFVSATPVTAAVARVYGGLFAALRRAGTPIPVTDIWIAAAAVESQGNLVTFDRHFAKIPGLALTLFED